MTSALTLLPPDDHSVLVQPMFNGRVLGSATAFLVASSDGFQLVTNWHVLSGRNAETQVILDETGGATPDVLRAHMTTQDGRTRVAVDLPLRDGDDQPLWMEHPAHGRKVDVATLQLSFNGDRDTWFPRGWYTTKGYGTDIFISIGERVTVVGYPFGLSAGAGLPIWTQGFAATHIENNYDDLPCFLIDARTRDGQSGSPVIYYSSSGMYPGGPGSTVMGQVGATRFLGIYSGRINKESDLGRVWKPQAIAEVLDGHRRATVL